MGQLTRKEFMKKAEKHFRPGLTQEEMFEKTFQRPSNYFQLPDEQQWEIDENLGILDWNGRMTREQSARYRKHWRLTTPKDWFKEPGHTISKEELKKRLHQAKEDQKIAQSNAINHPNHYGGDTTYEAIKVIKAWKLDFCLGNTVKYICRAGKKGPLDKEIEDLEKAAWYLADKIKQLKDIEASYH